MATTLKSIAEIAGVSIGTVDRALHNRGRVKPEVAARIKEIANELNYKPNVIAQGLSKSSSNRKIAVIMHRKNMDEFFKYVLTGINEYSKEIIDFGVSVDVLLCNDFDPISQLNLLDTAEQNEYNAIVIVPINATCIADKITNLTSKGIPVILLSNIIESCNYYSFIGCDYYREGQITAGLAHIIHPGEGHLMHFSPSFQMLGHILRANGLENRLTEAYPDIHYEGTFELHGQDIQDYKIVLKALQNAPLTDIIVFPSAMGNSIMEAIKDLNLIGKVQIITFDDSDLAQKLIRDGIATATIYQHPRRQGYLAVQTAFHALSAKSEVAAMHTQYLPTKIFFLENLDDINYHAKHNT